MTKKSKKDTEFIVKATAVKAEFETGMVRGDTTGKPRPDLISPFFIRRLGMHMARGAAVYSARNWEKGQPISRVVESLCRHVEDFKAGEHTEDHLSAIAFNVMAIVHYQEMIKRGKLPAAYDDMPDYGEPSD